MRCKRFLSIDWDYFIDATAEERLMLFPDGGNENLPTTLRDFIWDSHYRDPKLKKIGVIPDYDFLLKLCREFLGYSLTTDSHKYAFNYIMERTEPDEIFEVYNIDFHHDLYNYRTGDERVNCGNWGTILREERPNMKFIWVKREDSDTQTIGGFEVEADIMTMEDLKQSIRKGAHPFFDFLFMCRSSVWSPPHLDKKFIKAVKQLITESNATLEDGIDTPRPYDANPIPTTPEEVAVYVTHKPVGKRIKR